jgi:transcriptional regulator with XRE-family HTH domain
MVLSHKIRKIRELRNFTQEYMAEQLGITQSSYSRLEQGEDLPFSKIEQIAKVLEIKVEDLINFDEKNVFNATHNSSGMINSGYNNIQNDIEKIGKIYEEKITKLEKENDYLKSVIDRLLSEKK